MSTPLANDPLLRDVPEVEGYKVLPPVVLYAKVGVGGMGAVYRGRHMKFDIDVAVKCLKPSLAAESEAFVSRFQHEARVTADITHENLIRIYDVSEQHGLHYLVLEYVDGETARARVKRKGPLPESEAATIVLGAARGLAKAHRHPKRIVHRDIKPENILVSRRGEVKLADLGIAKSMASGDGATFSTQGIIGTPQYMAPEQWSKRQKDGGPTEVGPHTDVWAFGATLYFLLTGENAFPPGDVLEIGMCIREERFPDVRLRRADVSPAFASILARCTEKDPKLRYVDAAELARALEQYLGETVASLVDRDSGTVPAKESLVSPPPAHTLKRIKVQVEATGAVAAPAEPQKTVTTASAAARPQPRRRPDARTAPGRSPGPSKSVFLWAGGSVLLLALLIVGWKAFHKEQPVAAPTPIRLFSSELETALKASDGLYTQEMTLPLKGTVGHATGAPLIVTTDGRPAQYSLEPNGSFEIDLGLKRDHAHDIVLKHAGIERALRITQDSTDPVIEVVSPTDAALRTKESTIDLVVRVREANLVEVGVGNQKLEQEKDEIWRAANLALPREGANVFSITAKDKAGRSSTSEVTVVRDTTVDVDREKPKVSVPEGWQIADATGGFDRWARKAHDPRTGLDFILIDPGSFSMGVPEGLRDRGEPAEVQLHEVKITRPYYLATTETSVSQWRRFHDETGFQADMGSDPLRGVRGASWENPIPDRSYNWNDRHPVTQVSWSDAVAFCNHYGYELPTEAQWEFAARAGTTTLYWWGNEVDTNGKLGNFADQSLIRASPSFAFDTGIDTTLSLSTDDGWAFTAPTGSFPSNPWGFFDILGNVNEWCRDAYAVDAYETLPSKDPLSKTETQERVLRGGDWLNDSFFCHTGERNHASAEFRSASWGFRVARVL